MRQAHFPQHFLYLGLKDDLLAFEHPEPIGHFVDHVARQRLGQGVGQGPGLGAKFLVALDEFEVGGHCGIECTTAVDGKRRWHRLPVLSRLPRGAGAA